MMWENPGYRKTLSWYGSSNKAMFECDRKFNNSIPEAACEAGKVEASNLPSRRISGQTRVPCNSEIRLCAKDDQDGSFLWSGKFGFNSGIDDHRAMPGLSKLIIGNMMVQLHRRQFQPLARALFYADHR